MMPVWFWLLPILLFALVSLLVINALQVWGHRYQNG